MPISSTRFIATWRSGLPAATSRATRSTAASGAATCHSSHHVPASAASAAPPATTASAAAPRPAAAAVPTTMPMPARKAQRMRQRTDIVCSEDSHASGPVRTTSPLWKARAPALPSRKSR
jgi:hypothetical protein